MPMYGDVVDWNGIDMGLEEKLPSGFLLTTVEKLAGYMRKNSLWPATFGFAIFSVVAAALTGPKRYNRAKSDAYECGIQPSPQAAGGGRFPIKYFLTAMLFIVFDIEIVFLYPWAVAFDELGVFGLVEMGLFIGTVFVAYAYVWRRGGLEWD